MQQPRTQPPENKTRRSDVQNGVLFVNLYDSVDDWNLSPFYFEHHDLAYPERRIAHVQEKDVASLEARLHASAASKRRKDDSAVILLPGGT